MAICIWVEGSSVGKKTDIEVIVAASLKAYLLPRVWPDAMEVKGLNVTGFPNVPKAGAQGGVSVALGVKVFCWVQVAVGVGVVVAVVVAVLVGLAVGVPVLGLAMLSRKPKSDEGWFIHPEL